MRAARKTPLPAEVANNPQWQRLQGDVYAVWQAIGPDCEQCAVECGEKMTSEMRIEACLDADRLLLVCNARDSHNYAQLLYKMYGYTNVESWLRAACNL